MSFISTIITLIMAFITGSVMYQMYDATKFILIISIVGSLLTMGIAIAAHRSRKSYIRFKAVEFLWIFISIFMSLSLSQGVAILILN